MGMDKYIKSLIDIRTRVNLPTFGALLRSEEDGKIMFLEHLNFDDGALALAVEAFAKRKRKYGAVK